jgi:hypothetical protein
MNQTKIILYLVIIILFLVSFLLFRKTKDEHFKDLSRNIIPELSDSEDESDDDLDELEDDPAVQLSEAIFSKNLNAVQMLYQNGMRFSMWNLDDAIQSRYLPIVNFILDKITIPIHRNILNLALILNYDENTIRKIRSKM